MLDVRGSALRHALRRPGLALATSLILGLALGANVAAFAILYGYLLRPLPYDAPGDLLVPREQILQYHLLGPEVSVHFFHTVTQLPQFRGAALYSGNAARVEVNGTTALEKFGRVTASTFALLGVKPLLGRVLSFASGRPGGPHEVVLSYAYWTQTFGASPQALGRTLQVDGQTLQIVGVMPPKFVFPGPETAFWIPFVITPALEQDRNINPFMLARRPQGWSLARVDAVLRSLHNRADSPAERVAERKNGFMIDAVPYRSVLLDGVGGAAPFWGLWGATLALLLVAALNVLNLALARQRERAGELHLREVLGGTDATLRRMLLMEFVPILLGSSAVAVALAGSILRLGLASPSLPFHVELDSAALVYLVGLALTLIGSLAAGTLATSFLGRRKGITLHELGTRSSTGRAIKMAQTVFASGQIGIAVVLAICAALFTRSLLGLLEQPLHYDGTHVTVAAVRLPEEVDGAQFWSRARPALEALPGAHSAALSSMIPFGGVRGGGVFEPAAGQHAPTWAWIIAVSPKFFTTLGIHPLAGRFLRRADETQDASVVLVSEALAREFFGDGSAIGQVLDHNMRIVGAVPGVPWTLDPRDDKHAYAVYVPITFPPIAHQQHLLFISIDSSAAPAVLFPAIRRALASIQPDAAVASLRTLPQLLQQASFSRAALTWLVAAFGGLAFLIAVFGVYAVVAYGTRMRPFELGIREVLGATRGAILRMMIGEAAMLFVAGGTVGVLLAFVAARVLSAELYGVGAFDPMAYVGSVALVGIAVLIAALLPALRATRSSPAEIMRG